MLSPPEGEKHIYIYMALREPTYLTPARPLPPCPFTPLPPVSPTTCKHIQRKNSVPTIHRILVSGSTRTTTGAQDERPGQCTSLTPDQFPRDFNMVLAQMWRYQGLLSLSKPSQAIPRFLASHPPRRNTGTSLHGFVTLAGNKHMFTSFDKHTHWLRN